MNRYTVEVSFTLYGVNYVRQTTVEAKNSEQAGIRGGMAFELENCFTRVKSLRILSVR